MKKSVLKMKDVIDINNGEKLGYIDDVEIDVNEGKIKAVILPSYGNFLLKFFTSKQDIIINWNNIKVIGKDVVLVDLKRI